MTTGKFIAVEGIEGAGKSTQIGCITEYFENKGHEVILTREPGGTEFGERLRSILLDTTETMLPMSELLLMFASRYEHLYSKIIPHLDAGRIVISDRWVDSSYAYQGGGRNLNMQTIYKLQELTLKDFTPDLTLFLNLPLDVALERVSKRSTNDRFEQESREFFIKTYEVYQQRLIDNPSIHNIDTTKSVLTTKESIITLLNSLA